MHPQIFINCCEHVLKIHKKEGTAVSPCPAASFLEYHVHVFSQTERPTLLMLINELRKLTDRYLPGLFPAILRKGPWPKLGEIKDI